MGKTPGSRRRRTPSAASTTVAAASLADTHNLVELCRKFHQIVVSQMDATIFFLGLYDAANEMVEVVWQAENGNELSGGSFPLGQGLTSEVILSGQSRRIGHWSNEAQRVQVHYATGRPRLPQSAVAAPLKVGDEVIGLVCVQAYGTSVYQERDLRLLESLADEAAGVIVALDFAEGLGVHVRQRVSELEAILASMADALLIIDARGRLVRLNRVAREVLGLDELGVVLGRPFDEELWDHWPLGGRAVAAALRPVVEQLRRTEKAHEVEAELVGSGRRTLSFRASPLHDADGRFSGGVIVFGDVSGRREVERFKGEMFSIASHDLKTPATVIKTQAQWLKRQVTAGEHGEVQEGLSMIAEQADRLASLLNQLLDVSSIESGQLEMDPALTDLGGILTSMARALQALTDIHVIEVHAPTGAVGYWDARRIEEVVQNLLSNAVKYSPLGGQIGLYLDVDETSATVLVRDTGIGLAVDEAPHVFERYYRGSNPHGLEGSGLGLYICQAIVTAHGGRIWAESAGPDQGSTFGFTLPLRPATPARAT
ncbi:MAG: GAF domain-containing sensor histidine kinase [Chloroflexi bacterium]|nr:GAF domain-containing sensor histidine kinase [Chloroflexota bacterium]